MISRLFLLTLCATGLSGCGTAGHMLGQATGLVQTLTAPILAPLNNIRLADETPARGDTARSRSTKPAPAAQRDAAVAPPQR